MEGMQWPSGTALLPNETNIFIMKISPDINTDLQQERWTIHYSINQSINLYCARRQHRNIYKAIKCKSKEKQFTNKQTID